MAPRELSPRRKWRIALFVYATLVLVVAAAAIVAPPVRSAIQDAWTAVTAFGAELNASLVPASLQRLVLKAAAVFLTPWLYLLMVFILLVEKTAPATPSQRYASVGFVHDLFAWFVLNSLLRVVIVGAFVGGLYTLYEKHLAFLTIRTAGEWHPGVRVAAAFLINDFLGWVHHVVRHKVPAFWVFHTIHHSQREMNMFTDMRVHVVEHFVAKPIALIPMLMLGLDGGQLFLVIVLSEAYTRFTHANVGTNLGLLRYLLVSPQSHRIHHSARPEHADKNFGVVLSVWDRLFGTQWADDETYANTGIHDEGFPLETALKPAAMLTTFVQQQLYPFRCIWGAIRGKGWELGVASPARIAPSL